MSFTTPNDAVMDNKKPIDEAVFLLRLYRSFSGGKADHYYCIYEEEKDNMVKNKGYRFEGNMGRVLRTSKDGAVPFYRAFHIDAFDHFYTHVFTEFAACLKNGYKDDGVCGYIFATQVEGTTPLWRSYHPTVDDHFYTISEAEHNITIETGGYNNEGIAGYVFPN